MVCGVRKSVLIPDLHAINFQRAGRGHRRIVV